MEPFWQLSVTCSLSISIYGLQHDSNKLHGYSMVAAIVVKSKGKGKINPRTCHERPDGENMYNYTLSLTSALDGVGSQ